MTCVHEKKTLTLETHIDGLVEENKLLRLTITKQEQLLNRLRREINYFLDTGESLGLT